MNAESIMDVLGFILGSSFVLILGLCVVLGLIWCLVPFAIFGIKPRLDAVARAIQEQTRVQQALVRELRSLRDQTAEKTPAVRPARRTSAEHSSE
ncbi:MAG: hypothetical protein OXT71_10190 [Acidobacteriota bacterium]|nr:hypothetical protein [Acidobacteriota bacterium]